MEEDKSSQEHAQEEEALAAQSNSSSRPHAVSHEDVPASTTAMYADHEATQMTCDVLCSLSAGTPAGAGTVSAMAPSSATVGSSDNESNTMYSYNNHSSGIMGKAKKSSSLSTVSKSHQLPMFLSKTYHMIDTCDPSIATWSESGDSFVVKNVEQFSQVVLPLYFKHSNFSSFARQLNFYGFRKLRTDPILTTDVDPRTSCYVRFFHEKFQKDRPDLLHDIKRATKSDQQSKDDLDSLKAEVNRLKECLGQMQNETDRRLAEMSYECNRRITGISAEYDKLAALVHQLLAAQGLVGVATAAGNTNATTNSSNSSANHRSAQPQPVPALHPQTNPQVAALAAAAAAATGLPPSSSTAATNTHHHNSGNANNHPPHPAPSPVDLMQSLSQAAAMTLQQQVEEQQRLRQQEQEQSNGKRSNDSTADKSKKKQSKKS